MGVDMIHRYFWSILFTIFSSNCFSQLEYKFGIYANEQPQEIVKKFSPLIKQLEIKLAALSKQNVKVKFDISKTYEEGIQKLVDGKVDFARFGAASYIIAKQQNLAIQLIAIESKNQKTTFKGYVIVHQDSEFNSISELKGRTFAFGGRKSTIGRYLAQQLLLENGISRRQLENHEYLDRHDKVGVAVSTGLYDAGALKESTYKRLISEGHKLQIIHEFTVPRKPWIAKSDLSEEKFKLLQAALLQCSYNGVSFSTLVDSHDHFNDVALAITASKEF